MEDDIREALRLLERAERYPVERNLRFVAMFRLKLALASPKVREQWQEAGYAF